MYHYGPIILTTGQNNNTEFPIAMNTTNNTGIDHETEENGNKTGGGGGGRGGKGGGRIVKYIPTLTLALIGSAVGIILISIIGLFLMMCCLCCWKLHKKGSYIHASLLHMFKVFNFYDKMSYPFMQR